MIAITFWILFGLIIGWVASIIDDPSSDNSLVKNMALGVTGSIIGGVAGRALEEGNSYVFGNTSMLLAIIGGALTIMAVKGWKRRTD